MAAQHANNLLYFSIIVYLLIKHEQTKTEASPNGDALR